MTMMRNCRTVLATAAFAVLMLAGCQKSVEMASFRDPGFPTARYARVMVLADTSDLIWRKALESGMVASLRELGVRAIESTSIMAPTRSWSPEERRAAIAAAGVDGILTFVPQASGVSESYVPPETSTNTKTTTTAQTGAGDAAKGSGTKTEQTATTSTKEGYVSRSDWTRFEIRLIDRATERTAWIGMHRISGPYSMVEKFCQEIAERMVDDRIVGGGR